MRVFNDLENFECEESKNIESEEKIYGGQTVELASENVLPNNEEEKDDSMGE